MRHFAAVRYYLSSELIGQNGESCPMYNLGSDFLKSDFTSLYIIFNKTIQLVHCSVLSQNDIINYEWWVRNIQNRINILLFMGLLICLFIPVHIWKSLNQNQDLIKWHLHQMKLQTYSVFSWVAVKLSIYITWNVLIFHTHTRCKCLLVSWRQIKSLIVT